MDMRTIFDCHVFAALHKQLRLQELVGDAEWAYAMDDGLLRFGDRFAFRAQVIGTEATASATWMWAWANTASGIPERLLRAAAALREWGAKRNLDGFTAPQSSNRAHPGQWWAMVASGLIKAGAFYRGPYDGGALFLLITAPAYPPRARTTGVHAANVMIQAIMAFEIHDHRRAVEAYLGWLGWTGTKDGGDIVVRDDHGQPLRIAFDARGRIARAGAEQAAKG